MAYTFLDAQNKLSTLLADSNVGIDDSWTTATRKKELNRAEMAFCKDSKAVTEYATGTISGTSIAVPTDWLETQILIINNQRLDATREVSLQDYDRYGDYTGSPPYFFYWETSGVRYINFFGSTTGQTYKWYYFKKPVTDMDADANISIIPDEYREALPYYAASELMMQIGQHAISDKYRALYQALVKQAQDHMEKQYLTLNYPNVDINLIGGGVLDHQGQGW